MKADKRSANWRSIWILLARCSKLVWSPINAIMPDLPLKIWRGDESTGVEVIMVPARNIRNVLWNISSVPTTTSTVYKQITTHFNVSFKTKVDPRGCDPYIYDYVTITIIIIIILILIIVIIITIKIIIINIYSILRNIRNLLFLVDIFAIFL